MHIGVSLHSKRITLTAVSLVFILLGFYLWQINLIVRQSSLRDHAAQKIQELSLQNKELEIQLSKADSLSTLLERIGGLASFESVTRVKYLRLLGGVVVRSYESPSP